MLKPESRGRRDQQDGAARALSELLLETTLPAVREMSSTILTENLSSDSVGSSNLLPDDSQRGSVASLTGAVPQPRPSGAAAIHGGHAPPPAGAAAAASPADTTIAPVAAAPGPPPASSASSAALGAAVAQSLGGGARPTTAPPAPAAGTHTSRGQTPPTATPNTAAYDEPPTLMNGTFNIYEPNPEDPGQYVAGSAPEGQEDIPIGVVMELTATTSGPTITSYAWTGGTYLGYVGGPATAAPPVSQAAPTTPGTTGSTYGFIVSNANFDYSVTVTVQYQGGGQGSATLTFTSDAPTGSLAVQQVGTQSFTTTSSQITVQLKPPIQISFTASTGTNTQGQFMIMQIIDASYTQYNDSTNQSWFLTNGPAFPAFNGHLHDDSSAYNSLGYPFYYGPNPPGTLYDSQRLGANSSIPAAGLAAPYLQDYPGFTSSSSNETVTDKGSFSDYLMYKPNEMGSVWIALSEIDWSWSATAINIGGTWSGPNSKQPTPTGPTTPSGAAAFPTWVNVGAAFVVTPFQKGS